MILIFTILCSVGMVTAISAVGEEAFNRGFVGVVGDGQGRYIELLVASVY